MQIVFKVKKGLLLSPALKDFFEEKIKKLEKFLQKVEPARIEIEIGRTEEHRHKGDAFFAQAQVFLPRRNLTAKAWAKDIKAAMTKLRDELKIQFNKYATKPAAKKRLEKRKV